MNPQELVESFNIFNGFLKQFAIIGLIGATIWVIMLYLQHRSIFGDKGK